MSETKAYFLTTAAGNAHYIHLPYYEVKGAGDLLDRSVILAKLILFKQSAKSGAEFVVETDREIALRGPFASVEELNLVEMRALYDERIDALQGEARKKMN